MKTLKVQKLYNDSQVPTKAHPTDSGFDLYAHSIKKCYDTRNHSTPPFMSICNPWSYKLLPGHRVLIGTGISATVGEGYELQLRSRSGLALKQGLMVVNGVGTVDEQYRGEICVALFNSTCTSVEIQGGDKIAQLVPTPILLPDIEVGELNDTERGQGGFGSTGRK